jgi:hypothetical protein
MKKLFVIFIVLIWTIPSSAFGPAIQAVLGQGAAAEASGCTAPQVFAWSMESTTITSGTPAGCSNHATKTATLSGTSTAISSTQKQDGTYSLYIRYNNEYATVPISMGTNGEEGELSFYIYYGDSLSSWTQWIELRYDDDNRIAYWTNGADKPVVYYTGGGASVAVTSTVTPSLDAWHSVVIKWKRGGATTLSVSVDSESPVTSSTALAALAGAPTELKFKNVAGSSYDMYYDLVSIKTSSGL